MPPVTKEEFLARYPHFAGSVRDVRDAGVVEQKRRDGTVMSRHRKLQLIGEGGTPIAVVPIDEPPQSSLETENDALRTRVAELEAQASGGEVEVEPTKPEGTPAA